MTVDVPTIRAPRGTALTCKGGHQEAALRMLMNNLDPDVAERPEDLVVYGGSGKAARDWPSFHRIVETLQRLEDDETLLIQSGKPVGVFRTHTEAPRVLLANSWLVPRWATWDHFRELESAGLTMYGQMTAGSWIYIGTQGILQGTYETFAACARTHFGGDLSGRLVVTAGLGGMGGAQPLAATMNGAAFLGVDVDETRIRRRVETGYCDRISLDLDEALGWVEAAKAEGQALSVGLVGNAAEVLPELVRRGTEVDVVFNIAEGIGGRAREAQVPAMLDLMGIEHTGSDAATLSIALDKALAKRLVMSAGVASPAFVLLRTGEEALPAGWSFPCVVKPNAEGSSKGVAGVAKDEASLRAMAREMVERYAQPALAEAFLPGREFTVGVLGNTHPRVLPPMEICFAASAGEQATSLREVSGAPGYWSGQLEGYPSAAGLPDRRFASFKVVGKGTAPNTDRRSP